MRHVGWHLFANWALAALTMSMWSYRISSEDTAMNGGFPVSGPQESANTAPSPQSISPSFLRFQTVNDLVRLFSEPQSAARSAAMAAPKAPDVPDGLASTSDATNIPALPTIPDEIKSDMRSDPSKLLLKCPRGHLISILSANGSCGPVNVDLKNKVWELCSRKNACQFDSSIIGKCNETVVIDTIKFVCSKVQAMDCFLFNGRDEQYEEFCLHMCMHFLKSCQSTTIPVTREDRLKCLYNLFKSYDMEQKCAYIMEDVESDNLVFNKEKYFNPKYEMGKVTITNTKWVDVRFKRRIENPVVITSALPEDDEFNIIILEDITTAGFRISITAVDCQQQCRTSGKNRNFTVQWLAISSGDHSSDLDKPIKVGVLELGADESLVLPLDTRKNWVVLTQVQKVKITGDSLNLKDSHVLVLPIIIRGGWDSTVEFFLPAKEMIPKTRVTLGYLALEDTDDMNLYGIGLKMLIIMADDRRHSSVKVKLPYTWPYPSNLFASSMTFSEFATGDALSQISSIHMKPQNKRERIIRSGYYHFTGELILNYMKAPPSNQKPPVVNVVVIEDIASALKRQLCIFAKKKGNRNVNSACYDECVGTNGVSNCVDAPDLIACYTERSRICYLDSRDLKHLAVQYVTYFKEHPTEEGGMANATKGSDYGGPLADSKDAPSQLAPDSGNIQGTNPLIDPTTGVTSLADDIQAHNESDEDITIRRNCIEGPWGEWSACSSRCKSDNIRSVQIRKRDVYAKNSGAGSTECITTSTRECADIPLCSTFCFSREGDGDKDTFQQQYFYIWSEKCLHKVVDKVGFSYTSVIPYNSGPMSNSSVIGKLDMSHSSPIIGKMVTVPSVKGSSESKDPAKSHGASLIRSDSNSGCFDGSGPCLEKQSDAAPSGYGACILTHARYDILGGSWSKDGSCICEEGIPCSAEEVRFAPDYSDILSLDVNSTLEEKVRGTPYQSLISLANFKRMELPWGPMKDVTYGIFKPEEVNNYCAYGNTALQEFPNDILWVNCLLAVPKKFGPKSPSCQSRCKMLRHHCEAEVPDQEVDSLIECIKDLLTTDISNIYVVSFNQQQCQPPSLGLGVFDEQQICNTTLPPDGSGKKCSEMCERVLNKCKLISNHKREMQIRHCMLHHAAKNDVKEKNSQLLDFTEVCTFKRTKMYGSGLVYCKTRHINCDLEDWSNWEDCSGTCINLDPENRVVPTRTRHRILKNHDPSAHESCLSKGIQFIENAECLWLPQCPDDRSITKEIEQTKRNVAWEIALETTWNLQSWVLEDSYEEQGDTQRNCSIYSGHRDVTNNKIIYQKSRCSCPPMMTPCSITESVNSYGWFDMLELLCQQNEMRSVLFNQSSGFYRYSCTTKTFIREDFDAHKELCNEADGTSFVSCSGASFYTHIYIFGTLAAIIGSLTGILIFVYTYNRSSFV